MIQKMRPSKIYYEEINREIIMKISYTMYTHITGRNLQINALHWLSNNVQFFQLKEK